MSTLKVTNFAGEIPRVSPRALPADASQVNKNLLATSAEFRPLAGDKNVAVGADGAKTLYRLPRNADGSLRTDDVTGWITDTVEKSFVSNQLNDDATARTAVSWDNGSQAPRVIDAKGADRLLGVPAPSKPSVTPIESEQFTREQAQTWVADELVPTVADALLSVLVEDPIESRVHNGAPVAGPKSLHGATHDTTTPWFVYYTLTRAQAEEYGLTAPDLGGKWVGDSIQINIETLPYWGEVRNQSALEDALRLIESPRDGSQLFNDTRLPVLARDLMDLFDPDGDSIKSKREEMEAIAHEFYEAINLDMPELPTLPTKPTKPTTPEYIDDGTIHGA